MNNYDTQTHVHSVVSTDQWALFIQDEYAILDVLTVNAGLRFDYFSTFGDTLNPRLALIYNPWQASSIKLLYGTAFKAPSQSELNYNDGGLSILPASGLKPERLQTVEFIVEQYFSQQLRTEFNLFHTNISDVIASNPVANDLVQNQNSGDVVSNGAEIQLEDSWSDGFQGRLSYSWQDTQSQTTSQRLTNSPEHMVKLNLIAPLWLDKVFLGFETQYMSQRKTQIGGHVNDHVISNLTLYTQKWLPGIELSGSVYNLFNERYFDPGSSEHLQNGIQQDGLTFRIKASVDF
jgi:iron complex outermembrane receptor protein